MLKRLTSSLSLGLSPQGIALVHAEGWRRRTRILADHACDQYDGGPLSSADELGTQLRKVLDDAKVTRRAMTMILADEFLRYFTVTPPRNAARLQDCVAAADMRFQLLYDSSPMDWQMEARWDAQHPFLACAAPCWLMDTLKQVAREQKLTLLGIRPHFIAAWERWKACARSNTWFGNVHGGQLSLSPLDGKRLTVVRTMPVPCDAARSFAWFEENLARTALLQGMPPPEHVQLCGELPPAWLGPGDASLSVVQLGSSRAGDMSEIAPMSDAVALALQEGRL